MREVSSFCFKVGEKQVIAVTKFGSTWTDNINKVKITFDKTSLKLTINIFFFFDSFSFWQITGIPIGSDPATSMENLFYVIMKIDGY